MVRSDLARNLLKVLYTNVMNTKHVIFCSHFYFYFYFSCTSLQRSGQSIPTVEVSKVSDWYSPTFNYILRFYAIDSYENHALNAQFGVMALPSILLFHNSRPIFKYNFTDYTLSSFSQFINILTGQFYFSWQFEIFLMIKYLRQVWSRRMWQSPGRATTLVQFPARLSRQQTFIW